MTMASRASAPTTGGGGKTSKSSTPPNQTLYVTNLNDKLRKEDLRLSLYTLFSTYGPVMDVVALKTMKMRGQAHVVYRDIQASTQAIRALQGFEFFGKELKIDYAKTKSDTISKLDGTFNRHAAAAPGAAGGSTELQQSIFAAPPSSTTTGAAANQPPASALKPPNTSAAGDKSEEGGKSPGGVKRRREDESDEEEAPMEEDEDDDVQMEVSSDEDE